MLYAGGNWEGHILAVDFEELEEMDASEIHVKRFNAKDVILPTSWENCKFPVANRTVQLYGRDQGLGTSILVRNQFVRGQSRQDFFDEWKGSQATMYFPVPFPDVGEARNDFLSTSGDFIYRHHVEPMVKTLHAEGRINSFCTEIAGRHHNHSYNIGCIAGKPCR